MSEAAEVLSDVSTGVIFLMAIPVLVFPVLYARLPWRTNEFGRWLMLKSTAFALLVFFAAVFSIFEISRGEHLWAEVVRLVVFSMLFAAVLLQNWLVIKAVRFQRMDKIDTLDAEKEER